MPLVEVGAVAKPQVPSWSRDERSVQARGISFSRLQQLPPLEQLEPSAIGRVAGWVAYAWAVILVVLGVINRDWEPTAAGLVIAACVFLSRYWLPGVFHSWVMWS